MSKKATKQSRKTKRRKAAQAARRYSKPATHNPEMWEFVSRLFSPFGPIGRRVF